VAKPGQDTPWRSIKLVRARGLAALAAAAADGWSPMSFSACEQQHCVLRYMPPCCMPAMCTLTRRLVSAHMCRVIMCAADDFGCGCGHSFVIIVYMLPDNSAAAVCVQLGAPTTGAPACTEAAAAVFLGGMHVLIAS
jgi:hypothetical protein